MRFTLLFLSLLFISSESIAQTTLVKVIFIVEDFDTHKGVAGALVTVRQTASTQPTLADGKVTFSNVPVGEIEYFIMKEGYQFETGRVNVSTDEKTNVFRIPISKIDDKKILVTGEVTDGEGRDVKDAWVEVKIADQVRTVMTDASGNYSVDIAPSIKFSSTTMRIEVKKGDCKKTEMVDIPRTNVVYKDFQLNCKMENKNEELKNNQTSSICDPESAPFQGGERGLSFSLCKCYYYNNKVACPIRVINQTKEIISTSIQVTGNYSNTRIFLDLGKVYLSTSGTILNPFLNSQGWIEGAKIPTTKNGVMLTIFFDKVQTSSKLIEGLEINTTNGLLNFTDVPLVHGKLPE
jgi:hypothetical protein